jgi:integrase
MEELYRQYSTQLHVNQISKIILGLLIYQGLAAEEITRLETVHIYGEGRQNFIRAMKRTNERWLLLAAPQVIELQQYMHENRFGTGPLLIIGNSPRI